MTPYQPKHKTGENKKMELVPQTRSEIVDWFVALRQDVDRSCDGKEQIASTIETLLDKFTDNDAKLGFLDGFQDGYRRGRVASHNALLSFLDQASA